MACGRTTYDTDLPQGATFTRTLTWKTGVPATPVNLAGYTARMQVRRAPGSPLIVELTTENGRITLGGAAGTIDLSIDAATTAAITPALYSYDLELVTGATVYRLVEGKLNVTPNITV
jgi:hypothetical protein